MYMFVCLFQYSLPGSCLAHADASSFQSFRLCKLRCIFCCCQLVQNRTESDISFKIDSCVVVFVIFCLFEQRASKRLFCCSVMYWLIFFQLLGSAVAVRLASEQFCKKIGIVRRKTYVSVLVQISYKQVQCCISSAVVLCFRLKVVQFHQLGWFYFQLFFLFFFLP